MRSQILAWLEAMDRQRRLLKMPYDVLANLASVSRKTVFRALKKRQVSCSLEHVVAIADVLGVEFDQKVRAPEEVIERQVQKRAQKIAKLVQGTMQLEAQGLTSQDALDRITETAAREIRAKPRRQLWLKTSRPSSESRTKRPSRTSRS